MQKLLICTVGTSIANQCAIQRQMMKYHIPWEDADKGDGAELRKQITGYLKQDEHNPQKKENLGNICAELNVLSRLNMEKADRIVFLASDNAQGRVCAEMLKLASINAFELSEAAVEIRRIEDLQVLDAKKLRERGLKNLVKAVLDYLANDSVRYSYDIILNPTGGFKGVVPFITILGMLYGQRSVYLFEFAEELINLPPLPFSFDIQLYNRVRPALSYTEENVAVSEDAFLSRVVNYVPEEHDLFMAFTEPFDDHNITISALAYCLYNIDKSAEKPLVAESALKDLSKMTGPSTLVLKRLIKNSSSPLWRSQHIHTVYTSDLMIIKQGHTSERIAGFMRNGRFLITTVFDNHDDYAANINKHQQKKYENVKFISFDDTEYTGIDENDSAGIIEERDKLLYENNLLQKKLTGAKADISEASKRLAAINSEQEKLAAELAREKEYANVIGKELAVKQAEIERMKSEKTKKHGLFAAIKKLLGGKSDA
jgi:putative CRISPR-associated protein (TIGR02619 family)